MRRSVLRAIAFVAVVALIVDSDSAYGRGPGGRSGGARAGGGPGGRQLAKPSAKKKKGNGGPQDLGGALGKLPGGPGDLQGAAAGGGQLQSLGQQVGQKLQSRDGQFQQNATQRLQLQSGHLPQNAQQAWQSQSGEVQNNVQGAVNDFQSGPQPFTAAWYADHPTAWQSTHPHADAWAAATATGVGAWLGWAAYDANDDGSGVTYYTSNVYEEPADDGDDDVSDDEDSTSQSADTQQQAGDWLQLGVYAVASTNGEPASRYLQLAVNRQGEIRGVYYDAISGASQNLTGRIDESTQVAQWSPDSNPQTTFRTKLSELTQSSGTVEVTQPAGQQRWRIVREQSAG